MLDFAAAKNGSIIPRWNGRGLISRIAPDRDAERFVRAGCSAQEKGTGPILIIGDICGYLGRAARKLFPTVPLIGLIFHPALDRDSGSYDFRWVPGSEPLQTFLNRSLEDETLRGLVTLRWRPSAEAFPEIDAAAMIALQRRVRIANGNLTTLKAFGRAWLRNTLYNALFTEEYALPGKLRGTALITAGGASLARAADLLDEFHGSLIALPSALSYLNSRGLRPQLVVQSDPGFYTDYHLREIEGSGIPIAAPFSASGSLRRTGGPCLLLNQGEALEEELIGLFDLPAERVPSMGTVAATALRLGLQLGANPLVLAGLDLCYDDIQTHVHPHSFDPVFAAGTDRRRPLYSVKYRYSRDSATGQGQSRALNTYSDWFQGLRAAEYRQVRRLHPSAVALPFAPISLEETVCVYRRSGPADGRHLSPCHPRPAAFCTPTGPDLPAAETPPPAPAGERRRSTYPGVAPQTGIRRRRPREDRGDGDRSPDRKGTGDRAPMSLLTANLTRLGTRFPKAAAALADQIPSGTIRYTVARDGNSVAEECFDERYYPLHSLIAPAREGERTLKSIGNAGFLVVLGLGSGWHLEGVVAEGRRRLLLVVDGADRLLSLLSGRDFSGLLGYPGLELLLNPGPEDLTRTIIDALPARAPRRLRPAPPGSPCRPPAGTIRTAHLCCRRGGRGGQTGFLGTGPFRTALDPEYPDESFLLRDPGPRTDTSLASHPGSGDRISE